MKNVFSARLFCSETRAYFRVPIFLGLVLSLLSLVACTNGRRSTASATDEEGAILPSAESTETPATVGFALTRVVRSNSDYSSSSDSPILIDLIGDGSSGIGRNCYQANTTATQQPCRCVYSGVVQSGNSQYSFQREYFPVYVENDLARCTFQREDGSLILDPGTTYVDINLQSTKSTSNKVRLTLGSAPISGTSLDESKFLKVRRYQCRYVFTIKNLFCDNENDKADCLYDPFQSEHHRFNVPFNFYSTNVGGALYEFTRRTIRKSALDDQSERYGRWECNTNEGDPAPWTNLWILNSRSVINNPGANSALDISPVMAAPKTGGTEKTNFYLAKSRMGVFTVAMNTYIGPDILTVSPDSKGKQPKDTVPPIGFAARPTGSGCPSNTYIPSNYQWVKLWAYKANRTFKPYVADSPRLRVGLHNDIYCAAGVRDSSPTCPVDGNGGPLFKPANDPLFYRIVGTTVPYASTTVRGNQTSILRFYNGVCTALSPQAGALAVNFVPQPLPTTPAYTVVSELLNAPQLSTQFPLFGSNDLGPFVRGTSGARALGDSPALQNLDAFARPDYLYVVTPPNVVLGGENPDYTPYALENEDECIRGPGNLCTKIRYELHQNAVGGPVFSEVPFPLCVVQPKPGATGVLSE